MTKTNEDRAEKIINELRKQPALNFFAMCSVANALDKAEKRGARRERERNTKYQVEESQIVGRILYEYDNDGNEVCQYNLDNFLTNKPQPEPTPKYTVDEATTFASALVNATYRVDKYNCVENKADFEEIRNAVVGAIAGSDKPVPQFDAEKVKQLIKKYAYHKWSAGVGSGSNSLCSRDYSDAQADIVLDELLSALHIE